MKKEKQRFKGESFLQYVLYLLLFISHRGEYDDKTTQQM